MMNSSFLLKPDCRRWKPCKPQHAIRQSSWVCSTVSGLSRKGSWPTLVLLDANPLEEISNTYRIYAVVLNGRLLPKVSLQKMLSEVEAAVRKKEMSPKREAERACSELGWRVI